MNNKAPCLNCIDRKQACHSSCEKYLQYRKAKDEENQKIQEDKYKESLTFNFGKRRKR